ncbi:MAG: rhamnulokinase [Ruminococcus sp.]|nr:rhamnulokinase [Ruminococcus sp.]
MSKKVLAVDYGASSGRGILAELDNGRMTLTELARFDNTPVRLGGRLYWDIFRLYHDLKRCLSAARDYDIESVAIDTWGVDFAVVSESGELAASPVHYRDERTAGMIERLTEKGMSRERLYELTGIEIMEINTLFQLMSLMGSKDNRIKPSDELLFMPDYLNFLLCGKRSTEPCIASTSQLLDARTKQWSGEIITAAGLEGLRQPEVTPSGTVLGELLPELCSELGVKGCRVISGCGHDTQCAVAAVPAEEKDFIFISTGTWCLIGTELDEPIIDCRTKQYNLSNETGFGGKTTMLKNIVGLWLIQQCRQQWADEGKKYSYAELEELAKAAPAFGCLIDPSAPVFVGEGNMPGRIKDYLKESGQSVPDNEGGFIRCIYESLALRFRAVKEEIESVTGKSYGRIYMLGGGVRDKTLAQFTANACGCEVVCGPVEATSFGNAAVQFIANGDIADLSEARAVIRSSITPAVFTPQEGKVWDAAFERFRKLSDKEK